MIKEQLIRKVTQIGNGAHIFAPKNWLGEEVIIVKTPKKSLKEKVLFLLSPYLEYIEGAYLYGSHARNEAEEDSDIDLLIITDRKLKIKTPNCEIVCLQKNEIKKAIKISPILIYSALAEAKPVINSRLLEELKTKYKPKKSDFQDYIKETKNIIEINKEFIELEKDNKYIESEAIPYSLILRLRGIFIIKELLRGGKYSNKNFKIWIKENLQNLDYSSVFNAYKSVKRNIKGKFILKKDDLLGILSLLEKKVIKL